MRSDRLRYEPLAPHHAPALFDALDDEQVGRYIGGPDVTSIDATRTRIERVNLGPASPDQRWINHAVFLAGDGDAAPDGALIGRVEATTYGDWAEIAYVFGPRWWGHGYASEATAWLVRHLHEEHGIDELWAAVHPDNAASHRLLERIGFRRVETPTREVGSYDDGDLVFTNR